MFDRLEAYKQTRQQLEDAKIILSVLNSAGETWGKEEVEQKIYKLEWKLIELVREEAKTLSSK